MESLFGMNGLALIRAMDWRRSASRSPKASSANGGRMPVSASIWALTSSSWKVSMPQSVWWMRTISFVPSSRWEMVRDRMTSSVATPPALRITCASPSESPSTPYGLSRASMQATTAVRDAGGNGRSPLSNPAAYCSELATKPSVLLTVPPRRNGRVSAGSYPLTRQPNPNSPDQKYRINQWLHWDAARPEGLDRRGRVGSAVVEPPDQDLVQQ